MIPSRSITDTPGGPEEIRILVHDAPLFPGFGALLIPMRISYGGIWGCPGFTV